MELLPEKDCTLRCRSSTHAKQILCCAIKSTSSQLRAYSVWLCHNFSSITDELGRNLLHVTASCGKVEVVEWLLQQCNANVDTKDSESGWTALHRSFFYGQLDSARVLTNHGANLRAMDHEGFTPLDLLLKDRLPYIEYLPTDPSEVYAWGSNFNYSLGSGNSQSSANPEILEVFRKDFISIKQVVICKFHSVFLSVDGKVFTCGYGVGGRLGQGTEDTCLVPSLVKGQGSFQCIQVAAGQDHLVLLNEDGQVLSCGLNVYHQLGHNPSLERVFTPKPISLKFLKGRKVVGIRAARFHSVIYTKDSIYTFGLNAGQLGHSKANHTQIQPKQVSALCVENQYITHVEASDGATVCATSNGDVYVLHEYQCRKIASRQLEISKLSVVGGQLDSRCDVEVVKVGGSLELRVVLLTKSGKVYLWRQTDPHLRRCLFSSHKQLIISDLHINHHSIAMITSDNEAYMGHITPFKGQRNAQAPVTPASPTMFTSHHSLTGFNVLLDKEDCHFIRVKRVQHIHRATSVTSDSKGRNFSVLQSSPKMGFVELPTVSESQMQKNFNSMLVEASMQDGICDICFKIGGREFAAHKYILASRSEFFRKQFSAEKEGIKNSSVTIDNKINIVPEAFDQILKFLYTNNCDFFTPEFEVKWETKTECNKQKKKSGPPKKHTDPLKLLKEASKSLSINYLTKRLEDVRLENKKIKILDASHLPKLTFNRRDLLHLSDVNLISENGTVFPCHKCVLVSRLDYFRSMLSCCWVENSKLNQLSLPISSEVLGVILDYLYTDKTNKVLDSEDTEFLCSVLMVTDQLLITRLKEICEMALVELITLKNATELLELASVCNSIQLKKSCMQYICINLSAIFEAKGLGILSDGVIKELSLSYRQMIPSMRRRVMTTNLNEPSLEDLIYIEKTFPVSDDCLLEKCKTDSFGNKFHENKSKGRRKRSQSGRTDAKNFSPNSRIKSHSESSEKDIVLDILVPKVEDIKLLQNSSTDSIDKCEHKCIEADDRQSKRPLQWIMNCPKPLQAPIQLEKIMLEEERNLVSLQKAFNNHEIKPIAHMSQKQKKRLAAVKKSSEGVTTEVVSPKSPPCPWAKTIQQSPPSLSFWETLNKRSLESSSKKSVSPPSPTSSKISISKINEFGGKRCLFPETDSVTISLDAIQKAEEKKYLSAINPKIKSLHIINIEDQAIEELLTLYKAEDNPEERVCVSRILSEVASPIWKKLI